MKAILVVGHGSRSQNAVNDFESVVAFMQEKIGLEKVAGAHMEISKPSIEDAVELLWNDGYKELTVVPYFLFNGNHSKIDIPKIMEKLMIQFNGLKVNITAPIGAEPLMADILIKRAKE